MTAERFRGRVNSVESVKTGKKATFAFDASWEFPIHDELLFEIGLVSNNKKTYLNRDLLIKLFSINGGSVRAAGA